MGVGTSIFLIAVGAVLDFAVKVQTKGFNLNTIGLILMIVGALGLVLSLMFWGSWGGVGGYRRTTRSSRVVGSGGAVDAYGRPVDGYGRAVDGYGRPVADPQATEYVEEERRY